MGEQERENTQGTFIWYLGNSTMIFPIDYSYREFAQETGRDYRTIKKYLEEDERLNGALNKLYSEKTETKHVPIPLEAGEFLLCYSHFNSCLYNIINNSGNVVCNFDSFF